MTTFPRRSLLAATGLAAFSLFASVAFAQTVTTYGLTLPKDVGGLTYSGAWQISPNGKKALVAGYDGGAKGEAVVMIYDKGSMPSADKDALAKGRAEFVTALDIMSNSAMNPKLVKEAVTEVPGMTGQVATAHIATEYAGEITDIHVFATAIGERLVGIQYKAPKGAQTEAAAKSFAAQMSKALQNL
jgi:hypothetical protein